MEIFRVFQLPKEKHCDGTYLLALNCSFSFELIYYASGIALGAILEKRKGKLFHPILCE